MARRFYKKHVYYTCEISGEACGCDVVVTDNRGPPDCKSCGWYLQSKYNKQSRKGAKEEQITAYGYHKEQQITAYGKEAR